MTNVHPFRKIQPVASHEIAAEILAQTIPQFEARAKQEFLRGAAWERQFTHTARQAGYRQGLIDGALAYGIAAVVCLAGLGIVLAGI